MPAEYRLEPCKSALNAVRGMPFKWSLNPYMGCVHRCTFCYVRHFEQRADRPSDDRYGRSIRVKTNVADVLRRQLARRSWRRETVSIGAATDPYQPAEGRFRLTRACLVELAAVSNPFSIITRGPLIVRDVDVLQDASVARGGRRLRLPAHARRARVAYDRARDRASAQPARGDPSPDRRRDRGRRRDGADPPRALRPARAAGGGRACGASGRRARDLGEPPPPARGHARALPRSAGRGLAGAGRAVRAALRDPRVSPGGPGAAGQGARCGRLRKRVPRGEARRRVLCRPVEKQLQLAL